MFIQCRNTAQCTNGSDAEGDQQRKEVVRTSALGRPYLETLLQFANLQTVAICALPSLILIAAKAHSPEGFSMLAGVSMERSI